MIHDSDLAIVEIPLLSMLIYSYFTFMSDRPACVASAKQLMIAVYWFLYEWAQSFL